MGPAELLEIFANKLNALTIPFFVTGSMASINYGEPRFTNDIDVVAGIRLEDVERFL